MEALYASPSSVTSPLERARRQEKIASASIVLIVGTVIVIVVRAGLYASTTPASEHGGTFSAVLAIAEFIVTLATLVLMRQQVQVAVHQIEHAEASQIQTRELAQAMQALARAVQSKTSIGSGQRHSARSASMGSSRAAFEAG